MPTRTVPLLPCSSIDEIRDFYLPLGFEVAYYQQRPNPCVALRRGDLDLQYFGMDGVVPEESYSTCLVLVEDTEPLFEAFAAGLRASYGKLPLSGFPRITRPRRRKNAGNLSGFSLIDPSGNWIRVMRDGSDGAAVGPVTSAGDGSRLAQAHANAVVLADSHGDPAQAAKILGGALGRAAGEADAVERFEALAFLAELRVRVDDPAAARAAIADARAIELTGPERDQLAATFAQLSELDDALL
ncbi:VOC family protein [Jiangella alkaliphila]|uniref:Glyoxalase-like domain-containing protein n=1 Tax=Jiangella alkaliphila TaxID=419479 RepID=A0A1H2L5H5_9ACTN|nr:hypothetical protein [Jiangella alkaliphila]SDU75736.1 hypothetical protein SAMN04488563_5028 [Jiangella alkaliphila]